MVLKSDQNTLRKNSVWFGVALLLIAGSVSLLVIRSGQQPRQTALEEETTLPPRRVNIAALGRIEPKGEVIDVAAAETGVLAKLFVTEGTQVESGQILAELDVYEIRKAERNYAASQLAEARQTLAAEQRLGADRKSTRLNSSH